MHGGLVSAEATPELGGGEPVPAPTPVADQHRAKTFRERTFGALRHRRYTILLMGTFVSQSGNWLHATAIGILVATRTEDPVLVGLVGLFQFFPSLLLGLVGGVIADRFDRVKIIRWMQVVELALTGILAVLFATGQGSLAAIYTITFGMGLATALIGPAWFAFYPRLVPLEDVPSAVSLNAIQFNLARIFGPALGGIMIATVGAAGAIALNSISFLALIVPLFVMKFSIVQEKTDEKGVKAILDGFRYVGSHRWLQVLLATVVVQALFAAQIITLMPALGRIDLGFDEGRIGFMLAAFGVGGLFGALAASNIVHLVPPRVLIPLMIAAIGATLVLVSRQTTFAGVLVALAVTGVFYIGAMSSMNALVQLGVEDHVRGRVMSMWFTIFVGIFPVAALVWGQVARRTSTALTLLLGGLVCLAYGVALALVGRHAATADLRSQPSEPSAG